MGHNVKSPCINYCKTDKTTKLCIGCFRNIYEISDWRSYPDAVKEAVLSEIEERKKVYGEEFSKIRNSSLPQGYTHVYTGNGKGKTTAALGVALRAAGSGLKTYILQLMKEYPYSEHTSLKMLKEFVKFNTACDDEFVLKKELPSDEVKQKAVKALQQTEIIMKSGIYSVIILDEIFPAIYFKLIDEDEVFKFMLRKPPQVELILTGRYAPPKIMDAADLVTEMKEVKHYYNVGVVSRKGIDS